MIDFNVLDVEISDKNANVFAFFSHDKRLFLCDANCKQIQEIACLGNIETEDKQVKLYFYDPYVCISERFGVHAAVVNVRDSSTRYFCREDYHADVSSYSIGFFQSNNATLLLHQTQWNRLDITNLDTGELLTDREIFCKEIALGYLNKNEEPVAPKYDTLNYLDYFHSMVHVSPNHKNFLSNGWVWHPVGIIRCFSVERFYETYELGSTEIDYGSGYNWDRPCAFIDDDTFVIAVDDAKADLDEEEQRNYIYNQLWFYKFNDFNEMNQLQCCKKVPCHAFGTISDGEVAGELHYDIEKDVLVALSDRGGFVMTPEGKTIKEYPEMARQFKNSQGGFINNSLACNVWKFSTNHHLFYKLSEETKQIITYGIL